MTADTLPQYAHEVWTVDDGLPSPTIRDIQTRDGYLWLATHNGLARFDGVQFTIFDPSNTPAFTSSTLLTLQESGDGALWIGSQAGRLVRLLDGEFANYTAADGLAGHNVTGLAEDDAGRF